MQPSFRPILTENLGRLSKLGQVFYDIRAVDSSREESAFLLPTPGWDNIPDSRAGA